MKFSQHHLGALLVALTISYVVAPAHAQSDGLPEPYVWMDVDGRPLPFQSDAEILEFLRTADIEEMFDIERGVTNPQRVVLHKDGVRMHAAYRDYDETFEAQRLDGDFYARLRDSYVFELPAYNLSRHLGLNNIPPVVLRDIGSSQVSLQAWVENARVESARMADGESPPSLVRFQRLVQDMRVFDSVIGNVDRNTGNMLWDERNELWLIDQSRAFMWNDDTYYLDRISNCSRWLYDRLKTLTVEELLPIMEPLTESEVRWVIARRDKVIAHIDALIEERGGNDQTVLIEGRE